MQLDFDVSYFTEDANLHSRLMFIATLGQNSIKDKFLHIVLCEIVRRIPLSPRSMISKNYFATLALCQRMQKKNLQFTDLQ